MRKALFPSPSQEPIVFGWVSAEDLLPERALRSFNERVVPPRITSIREIRVVLPILLCPAEGEGNLEQQSLLSSPRVFRFWSFSFEQPLNGHATRAAFDSAAWNVGQAKAVEAEAGVFHDPPGHVYHETGFELGEKDALGLEPQTHLTSPQPFNPRFALRFGSPASEPVSEELSPFVFFEFRACEPVEVEATAALL